MLLNFIFSVKIIKRVKILVVLSLLFLNYSLLAFDYSYCLKYYDEASSTLGKTRSIAIEGVKSTSSLLFLPSFKDLPRGVKIIKSDPFVGLYLVESKPKKYSYRLKIIDDYVKNKNIVAIGGEGILKDKVSRGRILKDQSGFVDYGVFSNEVPKNSVLSNICYQIYGLGVGGKGFISKRYLDRFLSQNLPYYGDIGVRISQKDKKVFVQEVDPFFKDNPFLPNDIIVSIDGNSITSYGQFEWVVSNLVYQKFVEVFVIRNTKKRSFWVHVDKRYGGFLLADTFLERFGIELDSDLVVTKINLDVSAKFPQLQVGDKIIWVDKNPVKDSKKKAYDSLREIFSQAGVRKKEGKIQNIEILILRSGLEFFQKI